MTEFIQENLSVHAKSLLNNYLLDKNIIFAVEYMEHDGYDKYGPESNLWDLYIIESIPNNDFMIYNYHWEDWFRHKNFDEEKEFELTNYELYKKENLLDAKHYLLSCIEKNIDKIDNKSLKNAFFLRIKDLKK